MSAFFSQTIEKEAFPNSSLHHSHNVIPQFLPSHLYCSVILLPPADLHVCTKIFPPYSVFASKKSNSLQAIKFFSCLCADLIGKVERQYALLRCWGWYLPPGINTCWLWKLMNLLDFEDCRSLSVSVCSEKLPSVWKDPARSFSGASSCYQMKPQHHYLVSGFRETPVCRSFCFTQPHSD